jgi:hypothetical protein
VTQWKRLGTLQTMTVYDRVEGSRGNVSDRKRVLETRETGMTCGYYRVTGSNRWCRSRPLVVGTGPA